MKGKGMFHEGYVYGETKVLTDVNQLDFETTGKTEISRGWKDLFNIPMSDEKESKIDDTQALPRLQKDENVEGR
ncbi:TPA: hypothetical protein VJS59_001735 [Streptococcus pyogenes]|uniref:hypothetical protein n=1 Tax=unclassified Peribacillus TaxID=2675266 RepID=UPI002B3B36A8|nr:hypothetical protein [Streptococcus pyogenes]HER2174504.1 hypothetical protein [Streptococcus pyogenes]